MTRKEKQKAIDVLKKSVPVMAVTQEEFNDYIQILNKIMDWLEQEPCEDANANQHNSNALNNSVQHINALELKVRQAVLDMWRKIICYDRPCCYRDEGRCTETFCDFKLFEYEINHMPPVKPQEPKTGHWSHDGSHWKNRFICSECGYKLFDEQTNFCPNCGARMFEPQERSE